MTVQRKNVVGANVRKLRAVAGMSQEVLAARLQTAGWDISRAGLSKVEAGLRRVIDAEVLVLARMLRCRPEELFEGVKPATASVVVRQGKG